jgi:uncharacterized glyoxalase superfamily protein PhnB
MKGSRKTKAARTVRKRRAKPVRRPRRTAAPAAKRVASRGEGTAPGIPAISTYLAVANISATMDFLERALGFSRGVALPGADGHPRYAEMRHRDSVVMLIRKGDESGQTAGQAALYAYVDDVDGLVGRAREAGAGVGDPEDRPWGDRTVAVTDPDGYRWVLATFKKLAPFV